MKVYSTTEASKIIGISPYKILKLVKQHKLVDLKSRMRRRHFARIPKESVDKYLENGNGRISTHKSEKAKPLTSLSKLELHLAQRLDRVEKKLDQLLGMWS